MSTPEEYAALKSRLQEIGGPDVYFEPSDWQRRVNPDQTPGGWVYRYADIDDDVHIDAEAVVCGGSALRQGTRIEGPSFIGPAVFVKEGSVIASSHVAVFKKTVYDLLDGDDRRLEVNGSRLREADVVATGEISQSTLGEGVRVRGPVFISRSALNHAAEVAGDEQGKSKTAVVGSTVSDGAKIAGGAYLENSRADGGALIDQRLIIREAHVSDNRYAMPTIHDGLFWKGVDFPDRRGASPTDLPPQPEQTK